MKGQVPPKEARRACVRRVDDVHDGRRRSVRRGPAASGFNVVGRRVGGERRERAGKDQQPKDGHGRSPANRAGGSGSTMFHGCSTGVPRLQDTPRCSTSVEPTLVEHSWNTRGTLVEHPIKSPAFCTTGTRTGDHCKSGQECAQTGIRTHDHLEKFFAPGGLEPVIGSEKCKTMSDRDSNR